ncbi:MAG: hypothetical protein ACKPKO_32685, partial [Candidatus Fonsibacter sp.]
PLRRLMSSSIIVAGGEIGEDGKESLRGINYNAVFTYVVKTIQTIQELHEIVKLQQIQIDTQKQQINKLINIILTS